MWYKAPGHSPSHPQAVQRSGMLPLPRLCKRLLRLTCLLQLPLQPLDVVASRRRGRTGGGGLRLQVLSSAPELYWSAVSYGPHCMYGLRLSPFRHPGAMVVAPDTMSLCVPLRHTRLPKDGKSG